MTTKYQHLEYALKEMGKNIKPYTGFTSYLFTTPNLFDEEEFDEKPFVHAKTYENGLTVEHFETFMSESHLSAINASLGEIQTAWKDGILFKSQDLNDLVKKFNYQLTYRILEHSEYRSREKELMLLVALISNEIPVDNENHFIEIIGFGCPYNNEKMDVSFNEALKNYYSYNVYCPLNITYPIANFNANINCYSSYTGDITLMEYEEKLKKQIAKNKKAQKTQKPPVTNKEISSRMDCLNTIIQSYMNENKPAYELWSLLIYLNSLSLGNFGEEIGQLDLMFFSGEKHKGTLVSTPCFNQDGEFNHHTMCNPYDEIKELVNSGFINIEMIKPIIHYKMNDGFHNGEKWIFCNTVMGKQRQHFLNEEKIMVAFKMTVNQQKIVAHFKNLFNVDDSLLQKYNELFMVKDLYFDFCINASLSNDGKGDYVSFYVAHGQDEANLIFLMKKCGLSLLDSLKWEIGYFKMRNNKDSQFCEFEPLFRLSHKPMLSLMESNPSIKSVITELNNNHPILNETNLSIVVKEISCDDIVLPIKYIRDDLLAHSWSELNCSLKCFYDENNYDNDRPSNFLQVCINNAPDDVKKTFRLLNETFMFN